MRTIEITAEVMEQARRVGYFNAAWDTMPSDATHEEFKNYSDRIKTAIEEEFREKFRADVRAGKFIHLGCNDDYPDADK